MCSAYDDSLTLVARMLLRPIGTHVAMLSKDGEGDCVQRFNLTPYVLYREWFTVQCSLNDQPSRQKGLDFTVDNSRRMSAGGATNPVPKLCDIVRYLPEKAPQTNLSGTGLIRIRYEYTE